MASCGSSCSSKSCDSGGKAGIGVSHADSRAKPAADDDSALRERLGKIRHKILVMSGKGGVGKSTVAVNLAVTLARAGHRVGLLDVDIHGPSIPTMLHLEDAAVEMAGEDVIRPVQAAGLAVMSIGFLLRDRDQAVIWRGPMKMSAIRQFLADVAWGDLDYLVIDSPPGTGDEPLSVCQLVGDADGAVIVTTPQDVATADVRRSISFCRQLSLPVLGVVENMSGFVCPHCGEVTAIFKTGGGESLATDMGVPFLGRIPIDPSVALAGDAGLPLVDQAVDSETAKAFTRVATPILALAATPATTANDAAATAPNPTKETPMRLAIPIADGRLSLHFGHCESFTLIDVDPATKTVLKEETLTAPPHEPGLLPRWLAEKGATVIIAGGMGQRAQSLFTEQGIAVIVGAPAETPQALAEAYLAGTLKTGSNVCDH